MVLLILDVFFGFLAGFFFSRLPFGDSLSLGFGGFLHRPAFSVHLLRLGNVTHIHVESITVKVHLDKISLDNALNLCQFGVQLMLVPKFSRSSHTAH